MSIHRYPTSSLAADHCRAGFGLTISAGPLIFLDPISAVTYILSPLVILFGLFACRTLLRQMTRYEVSNTGIQASGPIKFEACWTDLEDVELKYYSTRLDRRRGWMQLRIKNSDRVVRLDSTLLGFSDIVARAAKEAAQRNIALGEPTLDNMRALGIAGLSESTRVPTV